MVSLLGAGHYERRATCKLRKSVTQESQIRNNGVKSMKNLTLLVFLAVALVVSPAAFAACAK